MQAGEVMRQPPTVDSAREANQVSVQAAPGAVFLHLRRRSNGQVRRNMFIELTVGEAALLRRELDESLHTAIAAM